MHKAWKVIHQWSGGIVSLLNSYFCTLVGNNVGQSNPALMGLMTLLEEA